MSRVPARLLVSLVTMLCGCGELQVRVVHTPTAAIRRIAVLPILIDRFDPQRATHRLSTGDLETRLVADGVRDSGLEVVDADGWLAGKNGDAISMRGSLQRGLVDQWVAGTHFHYIQFSIVLALHDAE